MNRPGHRAGAGVAALGYAYTLDAPPSVAAVLTVAALSSAMLPDLDNARWFRRVDSWTPDEILGNGGPLSHRALLHWWGLPFGAVWLAGGVTGPWWVLAAVHGLIVGVVSHLALDAIWGRPGIPVLPWWGHLGIGLRNDGAAAWVAERSLPVLAGWLAIALVLDVPPDAFRLL